MPTVPEIENWTVPAPATALAVSGSNLLVASGEGPSNAYLASFDATNVFMPRRIDMVPITAYPSKDVVPQWQIFRMKAIGDAAYLTTVRADTNTGLSEPNLITRVDIGPGGALHQSMTMPAPFNEVDGHWLDNGVYQVRALFPGRPGEVYLAAQRGGVVMVEETPDRPHLHMIAQGSVDGELCIKDKFLYVSETGDQVSVFLLAPEKDPGPAQLVGHLPMQTPITLMATTNDALLCVAGHWQNRDPGATVYLYDLYADGLPRPMSNFPLEVEEPFRVTPSYFDGGFLYGAGYNKLVVWDLRNPKNPAYITETFITEPWGQLNYIAKFDHYLFVLQERGRILIFDTAQLDQL